MPDFANLRKALLREGEPKRVPMMELSIDEAIKRQFLNQPVGTLEAEVEFFMQAGYDFVPLTIGIRQTTRGETAGLLGAKPAQTSILKAAQAQYNPFVAGDSTRMWAEEGTGVIHDDASFDAFDWPDPDRFTYDTLDRVGRLLPDGAKAIVNVGAIFTASWMLMGMEAFCMAIADRSPLVLRLIRRIAETQLRVVENLLQFDCVGAICMPDDLAYTSGLIVSPALLREHVFPWDKKIGELVHAKGLPYMYHSDGRLYAVLDDLVACGFDVLHPCERASMDIVELKRQYGDRLCLCGNIDLDSTLTLGTPDEVVEEVKLRIREMAPGGGYCCGSSNSVPEYVPFDNYLAMIEAIKDYGAYPIRV
jgi:uroporphyrinogen decarboxylase